MVVSLECKADYSFQPGQIVASVVIDYSGVMHDVDTFVDTATILFFLALL